MVMTRQQMLARMNNPANVMENNRKPEETPKVDDMADPSRLVNPERKLIEGVRVDGRGHLKWKPRLASDVRQ